jgi:hypothetical protein
MKISTNMLKYFSKSRLGQKFYGGIAQPKYDNFLNNTLPIIESGVCTLSYVYATHNDKKIPNEHKPSLQWQNVLSGGIGMLISAGLNKGVSRLGSKIISGLKPELMVDSHKVIDGIKVGLPILVTSLVMRFGVATAVVPVSSLLEKIRNKRNKKVDK